MAHTIVINAAGYLNEGYADGINLMLPHED